MVAVITYLVLSFGKCEMDLAALQESLSAEGREARCAFIDLSGAQISEIAPKGRRYAEFCAAVRNADSRGGLGGLFLLPGQGDVERRTTARYGVSLYEAAMSLSNICGRADYAWVCGKLDDRAADDGSAAFVREQNDWLSYTPGASLPLGATLEYAVWHDVGALARAMQGLVESMDSEPLGNCYEKLWSREVNEAIDARIEKYRKADYVVDGFKPGASVEVCQVSHEFKFGGNIFNFEQFGDVEQNRIYREAFGTIYNAATVPFYWAEMEPEHGNIRYNTPETDSAEYWMKWKREHGGLPVSGRLDCPVEWRRPSPDSVIRYLKSRDVDPYGHLVIYPGALPKWLRSERDSKVVEDCLRERIRSVASHYGKSVSIFEVTNESAGRGADGRPTDKKFPALCVLPDDYNFTCFTEAARVFHPEVRLAYNNCGGSETYFEFAKRLKSRGARIDMLGLQMHILSEKLVVKMAKGNPFVTDTNGIGWQPERQMAMLRAADKVGSALHISEITIPSPRSILPRDVADRVQARILRDNYRLWFSWPSVERITYWNIVDGVGYEILASGVFNRDLSPKPAYDALRKLILEDWWTHLVVKADDKGRVRFRGFKGRYSYREN